MAPKQSPHYNVRPRRVLEAELNHDRATMAFDDDLNNGIYDALVRGDVPSLHAVNRQPPSAAVHSSAHPVASGLRRLAPPVGQGEAIVRPRAGLGPTGSGGGHPPLSAERADAKPAPLAGAGAAGKAAEEDETSLVAVMASRLRLLESRLTVTQKELKQKSQRLIEADDRIVSLQHDLVCANEEKDILANKIASMNRFLADYGLTWVGDDVPPAAGASGAPPVPRSTAQKPIDIYGGSFNARATLPATGGEEPLDPAMAAKAIDNESSAIAELPFLLSDLVAKAESLTASVGFTSVEVNGKQAAIRERPTVHVCVYSDGISVNGGPFRPYGWPLCDAFIGDILDGFFPYEFKDKFPAGFPIAVIDRSTVKCPTVAAAAVGSNVRSMADTDASHEHQPLTKEELLRRLPTQRVTAGGAIVNPRDGIQQLLRGPSTSHAAPAAASDDCVHCPTEAGDVVQSDPSAGNVTRIQIRFPTGGRALLHLFFHNTVKDLKQAVVRCVPAALLEPGKDFDVTTVFPRRVHSDESVTMELAGLVPNCLVHLRYK